jgi:glutathione S-transferase
MIRRGLRVTPAEVKRSKEMVDSIFGEVEALLGDGRKFLTGDRFTAADLTFASLAAPVFYPDGYARYSLPLSGLPAHMKDIVHHYRGTPAGAFAMRMYAEHRDAL